MAVSCQQCEFCNHHSCMHRVPIFSSLTNEEMKQVQQIIVHREYKKGEYILSPLKPMHCLFILNEGKVKVVRVNQSGKEQILYLLSIGDFFGETALFTGIPSDIVVEALEDTRLCTISKAQFSALLKQLPDIALKVCEELTHRLHRMETMVESLGSKPVDERMDDLLKEFSKKYGKYTSEGILIQLPLSREELANYLGLTRETVSRKLAKLQNEGVLKLMGHKQILLIHRKK